MLEALLLGQGWGEEALEDAALVATEVVQNAIEHGSRHDGSEAVDVTLEVGSDLLVLTVCDPGTGRDVGQFLARDVSVPPDIESPRGRGLYLIHRLSACFDRQRTAAGGCLVRVRLTCGGDA
jgi:anti-sigma regulatory factor (Ser/Thr protein kinase)